MLIYSYRHTIKTILIMIFIWNNKELTPIHNIGLSLYYELMNGVSEENPC